MRSPPVTPMWTAVAILAVLIVAGCQMGAWSGHPETSPVASPSRIEGTKEPSPSPPLPTATRADKPSPGPAQESTKEPHIAVYKIITAGDYQALCVSADGQGEYTRHSRVYEITARKQGSLGSGQVLDLLGLLADRGFFELEEEYQLPPPKEGAPKLEIEDVYYWVSACDGQREKAVLAHELAMPPGLQEITAALFEAVRPLPDQPDRGPDEGAFLLAIAYEVMPYLRREEGVASLQLDAQRVTQYPVLAKALQAPCSLVRVGDLSVSKIGPFFGPGMHMMRAVLGDKPFVVLLLSRQ